MHQLVFVVSALFLVACSGDDPAAANADPNNANNAADAANTGAADMASASDAGLESDTRPNSLEDVGDDPPDTGADTDSGIRRGATPVVPEPIGDCPTFETGTQEIMELNTNMLVGEPQDVKGPLLFTWHGTGSSGRVAIDFQLPESVREDIVAQGGIVIAPNDNLRSRTGFSANGVWYEESDLEYADHIVACAVRDHNIDPRRIYVTGCSAGGLMAASMGIRRSSYVAAVSPNSGGMIPENMPDYQTDDWVPPVLSFHGGLTDNVLIVNFGETSARYNDFVTAAGGFAVDCNHRSGHCTAPTAVREASWEFLEAHPYGTDPTPYQRQLPAEFPDYCEIW